MEVTNCHRSGSLRNRRRFACRKFAKRCTQEQCEEERTGLREKLNFGAVALEASVSSTWSSEMRVALLEHSKLRCGGGEREGWQVGRDLYSCIGQSWVWAAPG